MMDLLKKMLNWRGGLHSEAAANEWLEQAKEYYQDEKFEESIEAYTEAIALYPYNSNYYLGRAFSHVAMGNWQAVIADCTESIDLDPRNYQAYQLCISVYSNLGQYDQAVKTNGQLIQLEPKNPDHLFQIAGLLVQAGKFEEALQSLDHLLKLDHRNAPSYLFKGVIYAKQLKDFPNAIKNLEVAISLDPESGIAHYYCADAYMRSGDPQSFMQ